MKKLTGCQKIAQKLRYEINKGVQSNKRRNQYFFNPYEARAKNKVSKKKAIDELQDNYIVNLIRNTTNLPAKEIRKNPTLIEAYRANVKLKRKIKQNEQAN